MTASPYICFRGVIFGHTCSDITRWMGLEKLEIFCVGSV